MLLTPEIDHLLLEDDDDVIHKYRITESDYNIHEEDNTSWVTFYCEATTKVSPLEEDSGDPSIEINIPYPIGKVPILEKGSTLKGMAYDEEREENLASAFYYSHDNFEQPTIEILKKEGTDLTAKISGECHQGPIVLEATFTLNPKRTRSFE